MGFFKKTFRKATKGVRQIGRAADITYSKSLLGRTPVIGKAAVKFSRQAVATGAVGLTGGTILLVPKAREKLMSDAIAGYKTGAIVGAAIGGGQKLQEFSKAIPKAQPDKPIGASVETDPIGTTPRTSVVGPLAGAGVGFLAGGPIGAVIGGVAGMFITKK